MIGRYLRIYGGKYDTKKLVVVGVGVLLVEFLLNYGLTMLRGGISVYAPFARDCSIFIIVLAIVIFLLFGNMKIKSTIVNSIAKHVVTVYLFEKAIREILSKAIDLSQYGDKWYLFAVISTYPVIVIICCVAVDVCKGFVFNKAERQITEKIAEWGVAAEEKLIARINSTE